MGNSKGNPKRTSDEVKERVGKLEVQTNLEEYILDLQCRSMRDNLLVFSLAEYRGENRENCIALINDFCETQFDIYDIGKDIERAHMMGQRGGDSASESGQVKLIQNEGKGANPRKKKVNNLQKYKSNSRKRYKRNEEG